MKFAFDGEVRAREVGRRAGDLPHFPRLHIVDTRAAHGVDLEHYSAFQGAASEADGGDALPGDGAQRVCVPTWSFRWPLVRAAHKKSQKIGKNLSGKKHSKHAPRRKKQDFQR